MALQLDDFRPSRVLAIVAHPDDAEVVAGATLAKWASDGATVRIVIVAQGDKGGANLGDISSEQLVIVRRAEATSAAELLGADLVEVLDYLDGEVQNTSPLRLELVRRLRSFCPDVVVTTDPTAIIFGKSYVNHRDHRELALAVLDSVSEAAMARYFPQVDGVHQTARIYLGGTLQADTVVDVSQTIDVKGRAIAEHRSQIAAEPEWINLATRERAGEIGATVDVDFGEAFRVLELGGA